MNCWVWDWDVVHTSGAGKVITPERSSATFMSVAGFLDTRVDLDKSIEEDDAKYKAMLSMMASKFSYENEQYIGTAVRNHWDVSSILSYYIYLHITIWWIFFA